MAASVSLVVPPILQFFSNTGLPNVGGTLLTQIGGVNAATYQDSAGTIPLPNPIPLNSRGEVSNAAGASCQLFLVQGHTYVFTLYDALGNQIDSFTYGIGTSNNAAGLAFTPPGSGGVATTTQTALQRPAR